MSRRGDRETTLTFREALGVLWRRRILILLAIVLSMVAAGGYLLTESKTFTATATVQLPPPAQGSQSTSAPNLQLVTGTDVSTAAAKALGSHDPAGLASQVSASYQAADNVVAITATESTLGDAPRVANAFANAYVKALGQQTDRAIAALNAQAKRLSDQINALSDQIKTDPNNEVLKTTLTSYLGQLSQLQTQIVQASSAVQPTILKAATFAVPTASSKVKILGLAAVIGLIAGCGIALIWAQFDTRLQTVEEAEEASRSRVLAQLPYTRAYRRGGTELPVQSAPRTPFAESIRELRTATQVLLGAPTSAPVLVVTSPAPSDGKTLVTANLAASFALSGKQTILVSSDLRRPRIDDFFGGQPDAPGLAELLDADAPSEARILELVRPTQIPGLSILQSGHPVADPADGLASTRMRAIIEQLRDLADLVIFDSPPVLAVADAAILSSYADGVVVVLRAGRTRRPLLEEAIKRLHAGHANVVGLALNRVKAIVGSSYRDYYQSPHKPAPVRASPPEQPGVTSEAPIGDGESTEIKTEAVAEQAVAQDAETAPQGDLDATVEMPKTVVDDEPATEAVTASETVHVGAGPSSRDRSDDGDARFSLEDELFDDEDETPLGVNGAESTRNSWRRPGSSRRRIPLARRPYGPSS